MKYFKYKQYFKYIIIVFLLGFFILSVYQRSQIKKLITYIENDNYYEFVDLLSDIKDVNKFNGMISFFEFTPETPLIIACLYGRKEMIDLLLKRGADPNLKHRQSFSALQRALQLNDYDKFYIVKMLVEHGAELNPTNDDLPIIQLLQNLSSENYLLEENPSLIDENSVTDLDDYDLFIYLISKGAKIPEDSIFHCIKGRNLLIINYLIENNYIDLNKDRNPYGETPLTFAVAYSRDYVKVVQFLLDKGADKTLKNKDDETAYDIAVRKQFKNIIEILE